MATNLQFIKSVSGASSSSSLSITDVFSAQYDVYVITYNCVSDSTSPKGVNMRLINSSDSVISNSNYDYAVLELKTFATFNEDRNTNQTSFDAVLGYTDLANEGGSGKFELYNPFQSSYTFLTQQSMSSHNGEEIGHKSVGVLTEETSCTGFNIFLTSTDLTSETKFTVYGVK
jgi:hypothetical protein